MTLYIFCGGPMRLPLNLRLPAKVYCTVMYFRLGQHLIVLLSTFGNLETLATRPICRAVAAVNRSRTPAAKRCQPGGSGVCTTAEGMISKAMRGPPRASCSSASGSSLISTLYLSPAHGACCTIRNCKMPTHFQVWSSTPAVERCQPGRLASALRLRA